MKNLKICCSSFLIPSNKAWSVLEKAYKLEFSDYGDWSGTLLNSVSEDTIAIVLFLNDIIGNYNQLHLDPKKNILPFMEILEKRIKSSKEPTLVCLSEGNIANVISRAKSTSETTKIFYWLLSELELLAQKYSSFYFVDLDREFAEVGRNKTFDNRNWYFAHCHISTTGLTQLAIAIERILNRYNNPSSKVLVLDCDNTIWGGVIGEDGISGITLGQDGIGKAFVDFQKSVKSLIKEGVILTLASKNNEDDVWEVFEKHKSMVLKKEDVVAWKINWKEKSQNIMQLSTELDLGLDSFVFWDDNPIERDKTRNIIPEMNTIEAPKDIFEWPEHLSNLTYFSKFVITSEDLKKTSQYHSRAKFVRESSEVTDERMYLKSIKLKPSTEKLNNININRAVQLCAKTNQFNLRTIRHTEKDLLSISEANDDFCFLTSINDIYGDHGIVGLVCLSKINSEYVFLDTLLMSCRVLGRHLESWMLKEVIRLSQLHGYKYIVGEFIPTKKNIVAEDFFQKHGFTIQDMNSNDFSKIKKIKGIKNEKMYLISTDTKNIPYIDIYENN